MMYISMETAIALASVLGNVLVVLVVCTNRALRDTTFCFIVSLAVADIAVGALVIPLAVVISLGLKTQFDTCLFFSCLLLIITQGSILSLVAIAIDRYLRVKIPTNQSNTGRKPDRIIHRRHQDCFSLIQKTETTTGGGVDNGS
ncbi:adenosine receptor A1 [Salmo trutta]|uniref:adenosine receptor A1 n=1 Tax=Salmo trutta TaxID=8032 RepID=UPI001131FBA7|nr:adenosine receptor A1-like [Salmo trutta]